MLNKCASIEQRVKAKDLYIKDILLDCYQHHFQIKEVPATVLESLADASNVRLCAECHLNHDKALRLALQYAR